MKAALLTIVLAGCYGTKDAKEDLRKMGAPGPYRCIDVGGIDTTDRRIVHCEDANHTSWECTSDGCVRIGRP